MSAQYKTVIPSEGSSFNLLNENISQYDGIWHYHDELELKLVLQSSGIFAIGNEIQNFRPGTLVLIGEKIPHYWQNDIQRLPSVTKARSIVIKFKKDFLGEPFLRIPELSKIEILFKNAQRGISIKGKTANAVKEKMHQICLTHGMEKLLTFLEVLHVIANSNEIAFISNKDLTPEHNIVQSKRIETIINYINDHFEDHIRQTEIAKLIHMSPEAFSRYFKKITNTTFSNFLNRLRINKVCIALIESEDDITEIAYRCGFESLSNFNRHFKRLKNISPRKFRAQYR